MLDVTTYNLMGTITEAVDDLFDTMLGMKMLPASVVSQEAVQGVKWVGSVSFTGAVLGSLHIHLGDGLAQTVTAALLEQDLSLPVTGDAVNDVVRELSNMIGGKLKSGFCDAGLPCELSVPALTTGRDFHIDTAGMLRHERYAFEHEGRVAFIEVCVKPNPGPREAATGQRGGGVATACDLEEAMTEAVGEVFRTMLSLEVRRRADGPDDNRPGATERLVSTVHFTGDLQGSTAITVSRGFADQAAACLLGLEPDEEPATEDVTDVLRELGNMVGGKLKSGFCDAGWPCVLSVPSVTHGLDFCIETADMQRHAALGFDCGPHRVEVAVSVRTSATG